MGRVCPQAAALPFMGVTEAEMLDTAVFVSRSGYTGEDGFELSVPADQAERIARHFLAQAEVMPIGLGARDSLRLEAGLCLYGHDLDETTSPVEADLAWTIGRARRAGGPRAGGFPGAERILHELAQGAERRRVGLLPEGRAPVREGTQLLDDRGEAVGCVTSGGFGPSLDRPVAMGYVRPRPASGEALQAVVRGQSRPCRIAGLPFTPHRYYKAAQR
jgi:aminomethyltransferase